MRDGLRVSFALNEFVVGAVCVMVSICTIGYLYTHMPPKPAPAACGPKEPEVTIESIVYYVPMPAPKVNVKVIVPPAPKPTATPDADVQPESDDSGARAVKLAKADPVFQHRKPIITPALQQPQPR